MNTHNIINLILILVIAGCYGNLVTNRTIQGTPDARAHMASIVRMKLLLVFLLGVTAAVLIVVFNWPS